MTTSDALVKYYDCLKDSFTKIQDKDNDTALINAALRPKIREEFAKSSKLLASYLDYIKIFSIIYSDKFAPVCASVLAPLLKESTLENGNDHSEIDSDEATNWVHDSFKLILESKPDLTASFVVSVIKVFPSLSDEPGEKLNGEHRAFRLYFANCVKICTYLDAESAQTLLTKMLERINPPRHSNPKLIDDELSKTMDENDFSYEHCYDILYRYLDSFNEIELNKFVAILLKSFTRDFLTIQRLDHRLDYLILFACSLKEDFSEDLIGKLWETFTNLNKSNEERYSSIDFLSSFIARASYVTLEHILNYLGSATNWCNKFIHENANKCLDSSSSVGESVEALSTLTRSILYLITQRYDEMYEEETIERLQELDLDSIVNCSMEPMRYCEPDLCQRFVEVATNYGIASPELPPEEELGSRIKRRRRSDRDLTKIHSSWFIPFEETCNTLPDRIRPIYRNYYDHRNFTIYREC